MGSSALGLGAAWLVATSPAFLTMTKEPMSDVPAAAFWAVATWKTCRVRLQADLAQRSRSSAVVAGVAAAIAILIRPNLVPLAAVLGASIVWPRADPSRRDRVRSFVAFAVPVVIACLAIAWINQSLFGSPLASGYGTTGQLFSFANVLTNVQRYGRWLTETQTPIVFAGLIALLVPSSRIWQRPGGWSSALLLAAIAGTVLAIYAVYIPFDAWWFLRLLLPAWPAVCIGSAAVIIAVSRLAGTRSREVHTVAFVALGLYTAGVAN